MRVFFAERRIGTEHVVGAVVQRRLVVDVVVAVRLAGNRAHVAVGRCTRFSSFWPIALMRFAGMMLPVKLQARLRIDDRLDALPDSVR